MDLQALEIADLHINDAIIELDWRRLQSHPNPGFRMELELSSCTGSALKKMLPLDFIADLSVYVLVAPEVSLSASCYADLHLKCGSHVIYGSSSQLDRLS